MAEIEFDNVSKRYSDGVDAVQHLSLTVADGEFVILVGPSGCGKSTALRMVAGLEEITDGTLSIGGIAVNNLTPRDRDVAMIFQNYALYPHMTVRDNIGFALKLRRKPREEIGWRVEEAARVLDLEPQLLRKPAKLSGGQRQRVAMGRAIVREPAAFLMDEPLSNLDAKLRVEMRAAISRLQQRLATTTLYVTHDQTEAMTLGDRVAVMRGGVLQQIDAPRTLYTRPRNVFVAGFIGSPAMNFLPGTLADGAVETPIGTLALTADVRHTLERDRGAPREVIVGIRPESFEDARLVAPPQDGHVFRAQIGLTESMGAETYAHLDLAGAEIDSPELRELRHDSGAAEMPESQTTGNVIARLSGDSDVAVGQRAAIWVDTAKLHLFAAADGRSLLFG